MVFNTTSQIFSKMNLFLVYFANLVFCAPGKKKSQKIATKMPKMVTRIITNSLGVVITKIAVLS